jgi:hypothetical protein
MTFGAVFAAILVVLAAAGETPADTLPRGDAPQLEAETHPGPTEPGDGADDADPGEAETAAPAEAPAGSLAPTLNGSSLADANPILIVRSERRDGWALERLLEPSGEIVEHLVDRAGTVRSCRAVGSLFTLRLIEQRAAQGGEIVQVVRDASGALLALAVGPDGEPRAVSLLAPPPR